MFDMHILPDALMFSSDYLSLFVYFGSNCCLKVGSINRLFRLVKSFHVFNPRNNLHPCMLASVL